MMSRFYSRHRPRRHHLALTVCASLAACGSRAPVMEEPEPKPAVQSLSDEAHEAERRRQYDDARALYLRAIAEAPDAPSAAVANREMASALTFWGEYERAEARFRTSLDHDNRQARVWHDLGMVQEHRGNSGAALISLRRAVVLAPKEPRARRSYAALLVKQKRYTAAIEQYEALLELPIPSRTKDAAHEAIRLLRAELARQQ